MVTTAYVFLKNNRWYLRFKGQKKDLYLPFSGDDYDFLSVAGFLRKDVLPPNSEIVCAMSKEDRFESDRHVQSMEFFGFDVCDYKLK